MSDPVTETLFIKALDAVIESERKALYHMESTEEFDETGKPLYWNDEHGWVDRERAQLFKKGQNPIGITGYFRAKRKRS